MKEHGKNTEGNRLRALAFALAAFLLLICVAFFIFMRLYDRYIVDILYKERQQQMKEVTVQHLKRPDDANRSGWKNTDTNSDTLQ